MGVFRRTKVSFLLADPFAPQPTRHWGFRGRLYKLAKDQEAPGSSFFKTDDRRSLFRCEIQSSLIEINPRATELHTSPNPP